MLHKERLGEGRQDSHNALYSVGFICFCLHKPGDFCAPVTYYKTENEEGATVEAGDQM